MRIIFILPSIGVGGGARVVLEYANHLNERGHDVSVIYPSILTSQLFLKLDQKWYFIKKIAYKFLNILKLLSKPKIIENLNWFDLKADLIEVPFLDEKFIPDADIVVATWWETAVYVNNLSSKKGEKFYLIQHYELWGGPQDIVLKTYQFNSKKIVIAKWLKTNLLKLGVNELDITHIPNGINFDRFKLINSIGGGRPKRVAMLFSRSTFKGSFDGINALIIAKKKFNEMEAVLFGLSPRPSFLPDWIEYIQDPSQDELVAEIYNKSIIYLCPSWAEGWHLPPAEAMACGCAVVSTDIAGVEDYAIHGKTALLSPVKDHELLAENLLILLKNEELRLKLAYSGHDHIHKFSWANATDKMENLFDSFLGK